MFCDSVNENVVIGTRPHGTKMKSNFVISLNHQKYALITKFQFSAGSVDFKLPYEAISLAFSVAASEDIDKGVLILGGTGYSKGMLKFMLDDIHDWIDLGKEVKIIDYDDFVRLLRAGEI